MKFSIKDAVFDLFPDLRVGAVVLCGINNVYTPALEAFVKERFADFAHKYSYEPDAFFAHKNIEAWHEAYRKFGINPKKKKVSSEALLSRTLQKGFTPHINAACDCYLACETLAFFPLGGFDTDNVRGDIRLDVSKGGEDFVAVGETEAKQTEAGEVVYADNARILTRSFNYRDADATKITEETKNACLFVEAPSLVVTDAEIEETSRAIAESYEKYLGAKSKILFLSKEKREVTII